MLYKISSPQRGQSLLEYGLILAIVVSAIIVGGPILKNSLNSHFRLLDDATQDSLTEQIRSTTQTSSELWNTTCECSEWIKSSCSGKNRQWTRTCTEQCDVEKKYENDDTCCSELLDMSCGTLLPDGSSPTLIECLPDRTPWDSKITAAIQHSPSNTFRGTCATKTPDPDHPSEYLIADTEACAIGERKVRVECGETSTTTVITPGDPDYVDPATDPEADNTRTENFENIYYACKVDPSCEPACDPQTLSNSHALDCLNNTPQNTTSRETLRNEVANRKTTYADQRPVRNVKTFKTTIDDISAGAVQLPYGFVRSATACMSNRYCEAYCTQDTSTGYIYIPSSDGTTCNPATCQKTSLSSFIVNPNEFDSTALEYKTDFSVTILKNQHYIFACLTNDTITKQQGTAELSSNTTGCASENIHTLNGVAYCISTPDPSLIPDSDTTLTCQQANQLFLRVWTEGEPTTPGYTNLVYTQCASYNPSATMPLNSNPISACGTKAKVVTDSTVYINNCTQVDQDESGTSPWKAYQPSPLISGYYLGCYKPACTGNNCYFVYCE